LNERGLIVRAEGSMQSVRAWLARAEPGLATALLRDNPSYVFFRVVDGLRPDQGPIGALGVPLTPERSLAVDFGFIPMGAPVFVAPKHPLTGRAHPRLMLAQDQGGAIRGPARGDVFWGWGAPAAELAGRFLDTTEVFVLLPRAVPPVVEAVAEAGAGAAGPRAAATTP
jgi:membrane-bound lytic murein transglycosylase A